MWRLARRSNTGHQPRKALAEAAENGHTDSAFTRPPPPPPSPSSSYLDGLSIRTPPIASSIMRACTQICFVRVLAAGSLRVNSCAWGHTLMYPSNLGLATFGTHRSCLDSVEWRGNRRDSGDQAMGTVLDIESAKGAAIVAVFGHRPQPSLSAFPPVCSQGAYWIRGITGSQANVHEAREALPPCYRRKPVISVDISTYMSLQECMSRKC